VTADERQRVTLILQEVASGEQDAANQLLPIVYDELRRLARWRLQQERPGNTLQATALVHEAYLRLLGDDNPSYGNRRYFFAAAAEAMRRILIERARRARRLKHGGALERAEPQDGQDPLETVVQRSSEVDLAEILALDAALARLEEIDREAALVTKLRHYSGFSVPEIAQAIDLSPRSVDRKWALARAWLLRELGGVALSSP
jgi:RNA polymerase sigma factor (TIGR02999 family)